MAFQSTAGQQVPKLLRPGAAGPMEVALAQPVPVTPQGVVPIPPVTPGKMSPLNTAQRLALARRMFSAGAGQVGKGERPAPAQLVSPPATEASPIPVALNLPTVGEIRSGFPSVTARLFGGFRG